MPYTTSPRDKKYAKQNCMKNKHTHGKLGKTKLQTINITLLKTKMPNKIKYFVKVKQKQKIR